MSKLDEIFNEWDASLDNQIEDLESYQNSLLEEIGDPMGEIGLTTDCESYSEIRGA